MGFVAGFSEIKRGGSKNFSKIKRFVARFLKSNKNEKNSQAVKKKQRKQSK